MGGQQDVQNKVARTVLLSTAQCSVLQINYLSIILANAMHHFFILSQTSL